MSGKCHSTLPSVKPFAVPTRRCHHGENRVELEQVESISYLGVILNDDLKWSNHVSSISSKASRVFKGTVQPFE
jgi:hypothetical protein